MNSAEYVSKLIADEKAKGLSLQQVAWDAALACVGWSYVFGARWQYCTPAVRRARYSDSHPTIKSACKNFNGSGSCSGCKWYPNGKLTRCNDCRGFTYGVLKAVYGWELKGAGCTSQWNTEANWKAKGKIANGVPKDTLVCLFYSKDGKEKTWEHTGFGLNGETVECSSGVQYNKTRNKKWTHWAVPACIDGDVPAPTPDPKPDPADKPTLRRGSKGEYVKKLQTLLADKGYDLGKCGIDGDFGSSTLAAVKKFQKDHGLTVDGVVGAKTWAALEQQTSITYYSVTVKHLTESQAKALVGMYDNASMTAERG